jgi:hypothetical protein
MGKKIHKSNLEAALPSWYLSVHKIVLVTESDFHFSDFDFVWKAESL